MKQALILAWIFSESFYDEKTTLKRPLQYIQRLIARLARVGNLLREWSSPGISVLDFLEKQEKEGV